MHLSRSGAEVFGTCGGAGAEERDEKGLVAVPHAVADPRAVVVELRHAPVAVPARVPDTQRRVTCTWSQSERVEAESCTDSARTDGNGAVTTKTKQKHVSGRHQSMRHVWRDAMMRVNIGLVGGPRGEEPAVLGAERLADVACAADVVGPARQQLLRTHARQNQTQETAFSAQIGPRMRFLVLELAVYMPSKSRPRDRQSTCLRCLRDRENTTQVTCWLGRHDSRLARSWR